MTRPLAMISVVGIFVLGIAVGALGLHLHGALGSRLHDVAGKVFHGHTAIDDPRHIDLLARELGLNDEQKGQVATILSEARGESRRLHERMLPAVHEHIRRTHARVAEILTPEQNQILDALTEKHRGHLERMFLTPGAP